VAEASGCEASFVDAEVERVLGLGALLGDATPEGVRWRWAES
jgi:hypothetical protein